MMLDPAGLMEMRQQAVDAARKALSEAKGTQERHDARATLATAQRALNSTKEAVDENETQGR